MKFLKVRAPRVMNVSKVLLSVFFLLLFYALNQPVHGQTPSAAQKVESLFSDDTCAPPCWFGLTVGQSTTDDAIRMFETHNDLFFTDLRENQDHIIEVVLDLQPLVEGHELGFYWLQKESESPLANSLIQVNDGIISHIRINANKAVSLNTTLKRLGKPSSIRVGSSLYEDYVYLYYRNLHIIVVMVIDHEACYKGILDEFMMYRVDYLTEEGYSEQLAADNKRLSYVPARIWVSWQQSSSDKLSCLSVLGEIFK